MQVFSPTAPERWPAGEEGLLLAVLHRANLDIRAARPFVEKVLDEPAPLNERRRAYRALKTLDAAGAVQIVRGLLTNFAGRARFSLDDAPADFVALARGEGAGGG